MKGQRENLALRINSFVAAWALDELSRIAPEKYKEILETVKRKYGPECGEADGHFVDGEKMVRGAERY